MLRKESMGGMRSYDKDISLNLEHLRDLFMDAKLGKVQRNGAQALEYLWSGQR